MNIVIPSSFGDEIDGNNNNEYLGNYLIKFF
ncbi:MAG: hypothetical protein ACJAVU_003237 [Cognaticolwellia sp.]|jgi:hypothetical protein